MSGAEQARPDIPAGSEVAGYRVEEQIGRGGMAVIYRARDTALERDVALKVLAPGLALDDAFRQRFIRESRAAAAVDHPHIIPIFGAGEADGILFIAMRYVPGGDVRKLLDAGGPLAAARASDIITQVASALDAAHRHGLVHRDIKPSNILLGPAAGRDHVYLADFGLSKRSLSMTGITSIGQFLGTPAYVAPEQIQGRPVDGRADQYALACASFEMLCGAPPFARDDDIAIIWAHVSDPPPSLAARRPGLPDAVDGVLTRALAKSPDDRYPTCLAFAAALRDALRLPREDHDAPPPEQAPAAPQPPAPELPPAAPEPTAAEQSPAAEQSAPATTTIPVTRPDAPQAPPQARPRWRSRTAAIAAACVVVLGIAGWVLYGHGESGGGAPRPVLFSAPGCSTAVAPAAALSRVRTTLTTTGGEPFGVITTADGGASFVTLGNSIAVLSDRAPLAPKVQHVFPVPGAQRGMALTHDGLFLVAATGSGASVINVINVTAATHGSKNPVIGTLTSTFGDEAVEVAISPDDRFAFVTLQGGASLVVFNLQRALSSGFGPADVVGKVSLGQQPVGLAISPDSRWLYVTSMTRAVTQNAAPGTLSVLNLQRAETTPGSAVVSTAAAGCDPARVVTSADGSQVWVTSRESDMLLGFSASVLRSDPARALIAKVRVGAAPIALAMVRGGSRILVADTDLHNQHGAASNVAVIAVPAALSGGHALLGTFGTGLGREFALSPDGSTLLLSDNNAGRLQAINVATLP